MAFPPQASPSSPAIVSLDMGYGHLRAAQALADLFGTEVLHADQPPLAVAHEQRLWRRVRMVHEGLSQLSRLPAGVGRLMGAALDAITMIQPLYGDKDLSAADLGVRGLDSLISRGLGQGMVTHLKHSAAPLLTTFYAPAIIADRARLERIYCVATDADIHRIWASPRAHDTHIHYFAPSPRVARRLRAYGVPDKRIQITGFPLPSELLGGPELRTLKANLAQRLVRLDVEGRFRRTQFNAIEAALGSLPKHRQVPPPLLTFAVGGAGAQVEMTERFLQSLRRPLRDERLRLALVAGTRPRVRDHFAAALDRQGLSTAPEGSVRILYDPDFVGYYRRFNRLLAETDLLWTKPSEMSFYAALGMPLLLAPALGSHEHYNRRWLQEHGSALDQPDLRHTWEWLRDWLCDGTLAGAAWNGFSRLPNDGTYRIAETLRGHDRLSESHRA